MPCVGIFGNIFHDDTSIHAYAHSAGADIIYLVIDKVAIIQHRKFSDVDLLLSLMFCICIAHISFHGNISSEQIIWSENNGTLQVATEA